MGLNALAAPSVRLPMRSYLFPVSGHNCDRKLPIRPVYLCGRTFIRYAGTSTTAGLI